MSSVDYDDRRQRSHRHRDRDDPRDPRDGREPRYVETQETYVRSPAPVVPEPPYASVRQTEIIRRPVREDSDMSIEEVRRDFPPPGAGAYSQQRGYDRYGPPARARSHERGGYGQWERDNRSYNDHDDRRSRKSMTYAEQEVRPRRRSLSRNQKILAGVGGALIAAGAKELYDRKQADGRPVSRNALQTAAIGAAGAFAGYEGAEFYAKKTSKGKEVKTYVAHQGRDGEVAEYYNSEDDTESVKPKRSKSRRKSIMEGALGLAGLGAAAKATSGKHHSRRGSGDSYSSGRSGRSGRSKRSKSRGRRGDSPEGAAKFQQAAKAALLAGATEAFRVRNEPGGWGGAKGKRILTAAVGAGGIDAAADRDPDKKSKRHILEAVVGGLAGNRLINGSRNNVEDDGKSSRGGRSRSRSRGPGGGGGGAGLAALATAGLGAIAGKKLLDRSKSRSRSRGAGRRRSYSSDSYDSRSPDRRSGKDRHKRSKSVTDYARKGLASLGIGAAAGAAGRDRSRDRGAVIEETEVIKKSRRRGSDDGYEPRRRHGGSSRDDDYGRDRGDPYGDSRHADSRSSFGERSSGRPKKDKRGGGRDRRIAEGKESASDSESSLGSSSEDERKVKKMKGKQLITAGLATVATIHAAHNVYSSMEKRDARHRAVQEGEMTPEEARKLKAKATLQDVASVGIAALGIKGALSEIKEANSMRIECKELREKKMERHQKRLERQKQKNGNGGAPRRRRDDGYGYDNRQQQYGGRNDYGPRYVDSNPYSAALPAPPVGYDGYDRR